MRTILFSVFCGVPMLLPFVGALVQPIDPAEDIVFQVRHPWRWCVRHPILAARRKRGTC